ncbi:hypothetical protein H7I76_20070 [Mycolicibacterium vaccae]|nr:hypothetical protein [Mycolicibacterium vaccae]
MDHSSDGHHPVAGIYPITLDVTKNASAAYLRATFDWHIDGCTPVGDECPQKATVLSAVRRSPNAAARPNSPTPMPPMTR